MHSFLEACQIDILILYPLNLLPYFVWVSSKAYDETAYIHRLVRALAGHQWNKFHRAS